MLCFVFLFFDAGLVSATERKNPNCRCNLHLIQIYTDKLSDLDKAAECEEICVDNVIGIVIFYLNIKETLV